MQKALNSVFFSTLFLAANCLFSLSTQAQVTQKGNNFAIEQSDRIGDRLFHSFNKMFV